MGPVGLLPYCPSTHDWNHPWVLGPWTGCLPIYTLLQYYPRLNSPITLYHTVLLPYALGAYYHIALAPTPRITLGY